MPDLTMPTIEFAFDILVDIAEGWHIGVGEDEKLWFTPITGGSFEGPRLSGEVLSGGGDWSVKRQNTTRVEARYLIKASDGVVVDVTNVGYFRATLEVEELLEAGQPVEEGSYYFRTAFTFRTDSPAYRWLAENQFIGVASDEGQRIRIRVFQLL